MVSRSGSNRSQETGDRRRSHGHDGGVPLDVFMAGDNSEAKATVTQLSHAGGLRVFDVDPLRRARQIEGIGLLSISLQSGLPKRWMSSIKLVD